MPIRINLLAEQQAAEDLRRRDPVKRALWVAGLIVGVMVVWSGRLQIKLMAATREINRYESEWKKLEPNYKKVTANFDKAADAEMKWAALHALATNRFAQQLAQLQKEIINATWKVIRREVSSKLSEPFASDVEQIQLSQSSALEQATARVASGAAAVRTALEMADLFQQLRSTAQAAK